MSRFRQQQDKKNQTTQYNKKDIFLENKCVYFDGIYIYTSLKEITYNCWLLVMFIVHIQTSHRFWRKLGILQLEELGKVGVFQERKKSGKTMNVT